MSNIFSKLKIAMYKASLDTLRDKLYGNDVFYMSEDEIFRMKDKFEKLRKKIEHEQLLLKQKKRFS